MFDRDEQYRYIGELIRGGVPVDGVIEALLQMWTSGYETQRSTTRIEVLQHGSAEYLFDRAGDLPARHPDRTIAAFGFPSPLGARDTAYQAGFPVRRRFTREVDRGHLFPHSAGGLFGPNIFAQDRVLNQGRSVEGKLYRAMETLAVQRSLFFFCALVYCDDTDVPVIVELGLAENGELRVRSFRNRFDALALERYALDLATWLACLTDREIADVGEETTRHYIETNLGQIVALGDSELPREEGRQDLDVVAIIEGELTALEVKTRYRAKVAGTITRAGNLHRPRLRSTSRSSKQGSQAYAAERLSQFIEIDGDVQILVAVVDLQAFLIQFYLVVNGRMIRPLAPPADCRDSATTAAADLLEYAFIPTAPAPPRRTPAPPG
jgi:hypothetical protein